jgi:hypothetical protein
MTAQGDPGPAEAPVETLRSRAEETEYKRLARERALRALELRKAGYTYGKIQTTLKYRSTCGVRAAIKQALRWTLSDPTDEVRALEVERLDVLLVKCNQILALVGTETRIDGAGNAVPNPYYQDFDLLFKAIDRLLLINIRRSKLLGLEVPPQSALLMAEYQKLFDQFAKLVSEVGGIIVKEAPVDVAQRILAKIAAFQSASAASSLSAVSAATSVGNGQYSDVAFNVTQVNINPPGAPRVREPGPLLDALPISAEVNPIMPPNHPSDIQALEQEGDQLEADPGEGEGLAP